MIGFICIFLIPILAMNFYNNIEKEEKDFKKYLFEYTFFLVIINFFILLILTFIFKNKESILSIESFTNLFSIKYITASLILCIIIPLMTFYFKKTFKLEFYIEKDRKKNEKKQKSK